MIVYFSDMDRLERREFVRKHRTCIFGYNRRNDGPAMTVVYYVLDGDDLLISTMAARAKALAVQRNPKVSLCILDEQWPLTYLQVYGDATLEEDFGQAVDVLRQVIEGTLVGRLGDPLVDPRGEADLPRFALSHAGFHASAVS